MVDPLSLKLYEIALQHLVAGEVPRQIHRVYALPTDPCNLVSRLIRERELRGGNAKLAVVKELKTIQDYLVYCQKQGTYGEMINDEKFLVTYHSEIVFTKQ